MRALFRHGAENRATLLSRLKNRLSRKENERAVGEFARLFRYLAELQRCEPRALPALVPLLGLAGQFLLLEFQDPALGPYSGREVIVFDERRFLYYRLPGALPNGRGQVARGRYSIRLNGIEDARELYLVLEKGNEPSFTLVSQSLVRSDAESYVRLEARELDYSWIVAELRGLVARWLSTVAASEGFERGASLATVLQRCPSDDPRICKVAREAADRVSESAPP